MAKIKRNKSAQKRFKITGTGRIKRSKAYHTHIFTKKSSKRLRHLRQQTMLDKSNYKKIRRLLNI